MSKENNFENLKPKIVVIGVGGAGGNAVNNMIRSKLEGVEFLVANTDAQALRESLAEHRVQLGLELTQGLGAGSKPDVGSAAAEETLSEIENYIRGSHMIFITAGMGGGTGTGAAPVIAKAARDSGILTVGVVTKPFLFEGMHRQKTAETGLKEMQKYVDTLIVIPNQNLFRLADTKTTVSEAFNMADNVLYSGVRSVTDLMIMPGLINLDFADVRTVMSEMGKAMMGTGEAEGDNRAIHAAEAAISNPLLDEVSLRGARSVLINITGGMDMGLFEVSESADYIREQVDKNANIIFGSTFDERLQGKIRISVVATGIEGGDIQTQPSRLSRTYASGSDEVKPATQTQLNFNEDTVTSETSATASMTTDGSTEPVGDMGLDLLVDEKAPAKKKESFFEKLGFKKSAQPLTTRRQPSGIVSREPEPSSIDGQDDLDIPAFLRRKK